MQNIFRKQKLFLSLFLFNMFPGADARIKERNYKNLVFPPSQSTMKSGSENNPWMRGDNKFQAMYTVKIP